MPHTLFTAPTGRPCKRVVEGRGLTSAQGTRATTETPPVRHQQPYTTGCMDTLCEMSSPPVALGSPTIKDKGRTCFERHVFRPMGLPRIIFDLRTPCASALLTNAVLRRRSRTSCRDGNLPGTAPSNIPKRGFWTIPKQMEPSGQTTQYSVLQASVLFPSMFHRKVQSRPTAGNPAASLTQYLPST